MTVVARMAGADQRAPEHLSRSARDFWRSVARGYVLESHHLALLTLACEAHDRATAARQLIDREGICVVDRFGQRTAHPAVAVERDSRAAFARLVKQLDLDLVPPGPVGRPGDAA
jgi:P27 family predicted phage terminase small subunit